MLGNTLELVTLADGSAHPIVRGGGGGFAGHLAWSPTAPIWRSHQLGIGAESASWSPDGSQIAYAADLIGLRQVNRDGTHRLQLSRADQVVSVAWSS
jgi:hypothetical protein